MTKIDDTIIKILSEEYASGLTLDELAKKHGVSHVYIHRLIYGARPASGITLETLYKMFPNAVIDLTGNSGNAVINSGANASGCINHHCNISTASASVPVPSARDFLDALIFSSEIDEALKASIYRVYSEFTRGNDKR